MEFLRFCGLIRTSRVLSGSRFKYSQACSHFYSDTPLWQLTPSAPHLSLPRGDWQLTDSSGVSKEPYTQLSLWGCRARKLKLESSSFPFQVSTQNERGCLSGKRTHKMKAPAERAQEKQLEDSELCEELQPMFAASGRTAFCSIGPGVPDLLIIPGMVSWPHLPSSSPHLSPGTALFLHPTTSAILEGRYDPDTIEAQL